MIRIFKNMSAKDAWLLVLCVALVCGQIYFDLQLPDYTADVTVLISTGVTEMSQYLDAGLKMLLCVLCGVALTVLVGYLSAFIGADFSYDLRGRLFNKVTAFGSAEMHHFSTASLITRTTNDVMQVQMIISMGLQMIIRAPIMAVWAIIKIVGKSWELSAVVGVAVVIIVISIGILLAVTVPKFRVVQKKIDNVNRMTKENLDGIQVVRAFNAEGYQEGKFEDASESLKKTQLFTGRAMAFLFPIMTFVQSMVSLAIYYVGAILINNVDISSVNALVERSELLGDVVSFNSYAMYVIMSFLMLLMTIMMLPRAAVAANRVNEVLEYPIAIHEGKETAAEEQGTVEFRDVSFRYPDAADEAVKHITFKAKKGETVAFIGATGSGKTTLVNLAARLYDATEGEVLIDGKDVSDYNFDTLYSKVGYITQKAILFADSIKGNITFGNSGHEISDEDVNEAIDIAQASEFVDKLPDGTDSYISQGGTNVSGGQKQRLSIARAIARKPEILIFDDSFSALDYKTDSVLRKRISKDLSDTTCLIVAQRIGTIKNADKILVLEDGECVGMGTHSELMQNCPTYKEIALSQLSEEELAANA